MHVEDRRELTVITEVEKVMAFPAEPKTFEGFHADGTGQNRTLRRGEGLLEAHGQHLHTCTG
jgi:hypothetical protein